MELAAAFDSGFLSFHSSDAALFVLSKPYSSSMKLTLHPQREYVLF